jgi:hypothetical protein
VVELELGEDVADVGLHRLVADVEGQGDLAVGAAMGELLEHLLLPLGELLGERAAAHQVLEHRAGHGWIEDGLAAGGAAHGGDQDLRLRVLADVADGAGPQRRHHPGLVGVGGQHHHLGVGREGADAAGGLDAIHAAGHPEIHHHHVGEPLLELRQGLLAARRGAHDLEVRERFEIAAQAGLYHAVVVDEDDAGRAHWVAPSVRRWRETK